MTSVNPIGPSGLVAENGDLTATQLVNGATLDSNLQVLRTTIDALIAALGVTIRSDNLLVDSAVRLRSLDPEVTALLGSGSAGAVWQPKAQVALASTANLTLSGEQTIDGILTSASRILVKDQTIQSQNGIYITGAGAWTRATDANTAALIGYAMCYVAGGTTNATTVWINTIAASLITLDTTSLVFARLSANAGASISPAMIPVVSAATVALARAALGGTGVGSALFTAATALVARQTLGVSAAMDPVATAASLVLARAAMGPWGDALVTATGGATARDLQTRFAELVNVMDYGAKGDGVTDDTAAVQAAANAASGKCLWFPSGTYKITSAIALLDSTEVAGSGTATILGATTTISLLTATGKTGIRFRNLHIKYASGGATQYIGAIALTSCTYCVVADCEIDHYQWGGVYLFSCTYCVVRGNHIHDGYASGQDCADVVLRGDSADNLIQSNRLLGGGAVDHGVLIQDHDGTHTTTILRNIVCDNRIEAHKAYGVACYMLSGGDQFTLVDGNDIRDIDGSQVAGASGMGIYIQTAGGCIVTHNRVVNCNISTSTNVNLAAAISVSFDAALGATLRPCIVSDNYVDTAHWVAIACSANHGCRIADNVVRCTDDTNGKGIFVQNADNVSVVGNRVQLSNAGKQGIYALTNNGNRVGLVIGNNVVTGSNDGLIYTNQIGGYVWTGCTITGNHCTGGGATAQALNLNNCADSTITGNYLSATLVALGITACTGCRFAANVCRSATFTLNTSGTCSNNTLDKSNDFNSSAAPARMNNAVAGNAVEFRSTGTPGSGTWAVGDRSEQLTPVVGQPKAWRCTVAGTPGTWVSEGNL